MVSMDVNPNKPDRAWKAREFIATEFEISDTYRQKRGEDIYRI